MIHAPHSFGERPDLHNYNKFWFYHNNPVITDYYKLRRPWIDVWMGEKYHY